MKNILYVIIAVITIYAIIVTFEKRKFESKYYNEIEKNVTIINDSIAALNLRLKDLTQKQQNWTENVQKESEAVNEKLKQDEKAIDKYIVTDAELADFIAKHGSN